MQVHVAGPLVKSLAIYHTQCCSMLATLTQEGGREREREREERREKREREREG